MTTTLYENQICGMLQRRDKVALALSAQSERLAWLTQREWGEIVQVRAWLAGLRRAILWRYETLKTLSTYGAFAEQAGRTPYPELLLSLYAGEGTDEAIAGYGLEKLAELLGIP